MNLTLSRQFNRRLRRIISVTLCICILVSSAVYCDYSEAKDAESVKGYMWHRCYNNTDMERYQGKNEEYRMLLIWDNNYYAYGNSLSSDHEYYLGKAMPRQTRLDLDTFWTRDDYATPYLTPAGYDDDNQCYMYNICTANLDGTKNSDKKLLFHENLVFPCLFFDKWTLQKDRTANTGDDKVTFTMDWWRHESVDFCFGAEYDGYDMGTFIQSELNENHNGIKRDVLCDTNKVTQKQNMSYENQLDVMLKAIRKEKTIRTMVRYGENFYDTCQYMESVYAKLGGDEWLKKKDDGLSDTDIANIVLCATVPLVGSIMAGIRGLIYLANRYDEQDEAHDKEELAQVGLETRYFRPEGNWKFDKEGKIDGNQKAAYQAAVAELEKKMDNVNGKVWTWSDFKKMGDRELSLRKASGIPLWIWTRDYFRDYIEDGCVKLFYNVDNRSDSAWYHTGSKLSTSWDETNDDMSFILYVGTTFELPTIKANSVVEINKTVVIEDTNMADGVIYEVSHNGTLVVRGEVVNEGRIDVYGTLIIETGSVLADRTKQGVGNKRAYASSYDKVRITNNDAKVIIAFAPFPYSDSYIRSTSYKKISLSERMSYYKYYSQYAPVNEVLSFIDKNKSQLTESTRASYEALRKQRGSNLQTSDVILYLIQLNPDTLNQLMPNPVALGEQPYYDVVCGSIYVHSGGVLYIQEKGGLFQYKCPEFIVEKGGTVINDGIHISAGRIQVNDGGTYELGPTGEAAYGAHPNNDKAELSEVPVYLKNHSILDLIESDLGSTSTVAFGNTATSVGTETLGGLYVNGDYKALGLLGVYGKNDGSRIPLSVGGNGRLICYEGYYKQITPYASGVMFFIKDVIQVAD